MKKIFKLLIKSVYPMLICIFLSWVTDIVVYRNNELGFTNIAFHSNFVYFLQVVSVCLMLLFFIAFVVGFVGYLVCEIKDIKKEKLDK